MMRLTMYLASLDITTAFDEARPRHVAKNMETHDTHEWLPPTRDVPQKKSDTRMCAEQFRFQSMSPPGNVEAHRLWQKMATQLLASVDENWTRKRGVLLDFEREKAHQICSFMWADNFWILVTFQKQFGTSATGSER